MLEIERKFLVPGDGWRAPWKVAGSHKDEIVQGYLRSHAGCKGIRVRVASDNKGFLTLKGPRQGMVCEEDETEIPVAMAKALLCSAEALIEKTRHYIPQDDVTWEVDVFSGPLLGLVIAEVELPSVDHKIVLPPWLGREVTGRKKYSNRKLAYATNRASCQYI